MHRNVYRLHITFIDAYTQTNRSRYPGPAIRNECEHAYVSRESVPQCSLRGGALLMDYEARPITQSLIRGGAAYFHYAIR